MNTPEHKKRKKRKFFPFYFLLSRNARYLAHFSPASLSRLVLFLQIDFSKRVVGGAAMPRRFHHKPICALVAHILSIRVSRLSGRYPCRRRTGARSEQPNSHATL